MRDRIVPIERTDLINVYYTMMSVAGSAPTVLSATNPGVFTIAAAGLCEEPVQSANVTLASGSFYFVPAFDYVGFYISNALVTTTGDDVVADGVTLYKATVSGGAISLEKVSL